MLDKRVRSSRHVRAARTLPGSRSFTAIAAMGAVAIALSLSACMPYSSALGVLAPSRGEVTRPILRSAPERVKIAVIGVNAPLMRLGLKSDRSLQVPPNAYTAGWYTGGPQPGQIGPAVIAAHVHWNGTNGAFAKLSKLHPGDEIVVSRRNGTADTFSVDRVQSFKKNKFPTNLVYGNINYAGLRLITCDGLDKDSHKYLANLVVFARLVSKA